jgi:hypothetical protein
MVITMTGSSDPYPVPFEWSQTYETPIPLVLGLIPHDCERGWYPLIDGSEIECVTCAMK